MHWTLREHGKASEETERAGEWKPSWPECEMKWAGGDESTYSEIRIQRMYVLIFFFEKKNTNKPHSEEIRDEKINMTSK